MLLLQFSAAPFRTIAEARVALEPMIAYLAAQHITDEALEQLARSVEIMQANLENRTVFLEENERFHDVIAWSSNNALFGYLVGTGDRVLLARGYFAGAAAMIVGGVVEAFIGVDAGRKPLESIASPLGSHGD